MRNSVMGGLRRGGVCLEDSVIGKLDLFAARRRILVLRGMMRSHTAGIVCQYHKR